MTKTIWFLFLSLLLSCRAHRAVPHPSSPPSSPQDEDHEEEPIKAEEKSALIQDMNNAHMVLLLDDDDQSLGLTEENQNDDPSDSQLSDDQKVGIFATVMAAATVGSAVITKGKSIANYGKSGKTLFGKVRTKVIDRADNKFVDILHTQKASINKKGRPSLATIFDLKDDKSIHFKENGGRIGSFFEKDDKIYIKLKKDFSGYESFFQDLKLEKGQSVVVFRRKKGAHANGALSNLQENVTVSVESLEITNGSSKYEAFVVKAKSA